MLWRREPFPGAYFAGDFLRRKYRLNGVRKRDITLLSGWSFARASAAYGTTQGGVLQSFASGVPRITDKGLLPEAAATNLILQSQTFDNASWTKSAGSVTADAATAPDGTTTADKLITDNGVSTTGNNGTGGILQSVTVSAAATWAFTIYAKAAEVSAIRLREATASGALANVNLSTGAITYENGSSAGMNVTAVQLSNGWWRITGTRTTGGAETTCAVNIKPGLDTGDGTSGVYIWGAQLEQSAYATSYIPTTTASVTRAADVISIGSITGLDYPLTLFAEFERATDSGAVERILVVDDGDATDRSYIYTSAADAARVAAGAASVSQADVVVTGALALATVYRVAGRINTNSVQMARGGTLATEDTAVTLPATPTTIRIGSVAGSEAAHAYLRKLAIFPSAYTDAQLQAITS